MTRIRKGLLRLLVGAGVFILGIYALDWLLIDPGITRRRALVWPLITKLQELRSKGLALPENEKDAFALVENSKQFTDEFIVYGKRGNNFSIVFSRDGFDMYGCMRWDSEDNRWHRNAERGCVAANPPSGQ